MTQSFLTSKTLPLRISKVSLAVLFGFSLTACFSSSDDDNDEAVEPQLSLERLAPEADVRSLQVDGNDLIMASYSYIYRLAPEQEPELLISVGSSEALVRVLGPGHYLAASSYAHQIAETEDGGENWERTFGVFDNAEGIGQDVHYISQFKPIDDRLYFRQHASLLSSDREFTTVELESGSLEFATTQATGIERTLMYNEAHDELWWTEFTHEAPDEPMLVKRLNRESGELDTLFQHESAFFLDGFADANDPDVIVLGGEGGLRISYNNGADWATWPDTDEELTVYSVRQDEASDHYYAYASIGDSPRVDELWCSSDQGQSWSRTYLSEGTDGIIAASAPMIFMGDGEDRRFYIPTRRGVVAGSLAAVSC